MIKNDEYKLRRKFIDMKTRCYNKKHTSYKNHGARGINICDEWLNNPKLFIQWSLNNGYKDGLTIDRINNDKGYCPENCRYTTIKIQNRNTRQNVFIEFNDEVLCFNDMCRKYNINRITARTRMNRLGWSVEKTFSTPIDIKKRNKIMKRGG